MAKPQRFLLINPWIHDFAAYDFWMRPLGLLYLASVINEAGCQLDYIDCLDRFHPALEEIQTQDFPRAKPDGRGKLFRTEIPKPPPLSHIPRRFSRYGITPEIFHGELSSVEKPDAVLVTSSMTYWYTGVQETIRELRSVLPNIPVILGGVYATLLPKHSARRSGANVVISGESENKIVSALEKVTNRQLPRRKHCTSIDDYPFPMFLLLRNTQSLPILTSRGCPFRCGYCASWKLMPGFRRRDPLKVVDEIEFHHRNLATEHFAFYDDALLIDKKEHFQLILNEVVRRGVKASFHMPNAVHGREIDSRTAELMFLAGCRTVRIGFETSNEKRQTDSGAKITSGDLLRAIVNLETAGYDRKDIEVYVMMGLPGQSTREVENSMRFVNDAGCTVRLVSFTPIPGTPYWQQAVEQMPSIAEEPLLQNNSIFPLCGTAAGWEEFAGLRDMARHINRAL
jgi:radical SAM superfamily enzyme YgiQ (UPF0313 family)